MKPADVNAGDIFRVTMNRANGITPPKGDESRDKFFVVLGFDDDGNVYGGVIFNSLMNLNLPPFIQTMQYAIKKDSYGFLAHDSYIDCSAIKSVRKTKLLKSTYLGTLKATDMNDIITKIKGNSRISKIELKRFGII